MRKLLYAFLIALLPCVAFAGSPAWNLMIAPTAAAAGAPTYCTTCTGTANATACEGFTSGSPLCTWTEIDSSFTGTYSYSTSNPVALGECTDESGYTFYMSRTGGSKTTYIDTGSSQTDFTVQFYILWPGPGSLFDGDAFIVFRADDSADFSSTASEVHFVNTNDSPSQQAIHSHYWANGDRTVGTMSVEDMVNSWYRVRVKMGAAIGQELCVQKDGGAETCWSDATTTAMRSVRYFEIGGTHASRNMAYYITSIRVRTGTTTYPDACQ